jgi:hypothetical protein
VAAIGAEIGMCTVPISDVHYKSATATPPKYKCNLPKLDRQASRESTGANLGTISSFSCSTHGNGVNPLNNMQGGRGREGNDRGWSGGHGMSVHVCGADLSAIDSLSLISHNTHWTYKNPPAVGAGDVGEEGGMASAQLEAVKREWRGGGPVWAQSRRSRVLPMGPVEIHLLWVQGM